MEVQVTEQMADRGLIFRPDEKDVTSLWYRQRKL